MTKVKVTYEKLIRFNDYANAWLNKGVLSEDGREMTHPNQERSPFKYAIEKNLLRIEPLFKKRSEEIADLREFFAMTTKKKQEDGTEQVMYVFKTTKNDKGEDKEDYSFSSENTKKLIKAVREYDEKEVDFEPYYATSVPNDLDVLMEDAFAGIAIDPSKIKEPNFDIETNSVPKTEEVKPVLSVEVKEFKEENSSIK